MWIDLGSRSPPKGYCDCTVWFSDLCGLFSLPAWQPLDDSLDQVTSGMHMGSGERGEGPFLCAPSPNSTLGIRPAYS